MAYSTRAREYLVVWIGTTELGEEDNTDRVFGQHVSGTGGQRGTNDFPLSVPYGSEFLGGTSVAQHADQPEYMVLWHFFENETQARRVSALSGRPRRSYPSAGRSRREAPAASDGARLSGTSRVSASSSSSTLRGGRRGTRRRGRRPAH